MISLSMETRQLAGKPAVELTKRIVLLASIATRSDVVIRLFATLSCASVATAAGKTATGVLIRFSRADKGFSCDAITIPMKGYWARGQWKQNTVTAALLLAEAFAAYFIVDVVTTLYR